MNPMIEQLNLMERHESKLWAFNEHSLVPMIRSIEQPLG